MEYEEVDSMEILKASKPANVSEQVDEIEIIGEEKGALSAEIVDELSIKSDNRAPLLVEPVDELSVPSEYDIKLAKSTWDSLDVQGSGFELLGYPTVSRLENQDVFLYENQRDKKPRAWNCTLETDYNDELLIDAPERPELEIEFLDDFTIITSKDDISIRAAEKVNKTSKISKIEKLLFRGIKPKYQIVSKDVNAEKIISTRDETINVVRSKPKGREQVESESVSESVSHISKKVVVDIKHKEKKKYLILKV